MEKQDWEKALCEALENEKTLLENLAAAAAEKRGELETGNIAGIDALVNTEQALAAQLEAAENRRLGLLGERGLAGLTLEQLAQQAHGPCAEELCESLRQLRETARRLREINEINGRISRVRLDFYDYLFARGSGVKKDAAAGFYGSSGRLRKDRRALAMIDTQA